MDLVQNFSKVYQGGQEYYVATKTGQQKVNKLGYKKEVYNYFKAKDINKIPLKITDDVYKKHINGEQYLTLPPINENGQCAFGALDIDVYDKEQVDIIIKQIADNKLPLLPWITASKGLHLYLYSRELIDAALMRNALISYAIMLNIKDSEVFPKQETAATGNGIKLPCFNSSEEILKDHLIKIYQIRQNRDFFLNFKKAEVKHSEKKNFTAESKVDTNDLKEIIKNIKSQKEHTRGGDVDNHIVDFVSVACGSNFTDKEIIKKLSSVKEEIMLGTSASKYGNISSYIKARINNFRNKFEIIDPEEAQRNFLNNVVFLKDSCTYFDKTKNKIYKAEVIKITFTKELGVKDAVKFFSDSRDRILCESFKYRPKQYDQKNCIITVDKLLYVNKYKPHDLEAVGGDVSLFIKLVEHVIPDETVRTFFLDFISYHYQYPGEKIRFGFILQTTEFQIGKGSIWYAIKNTLGDNVKKVDIEESLDKAKTFLSDRQLVLIDEMKSKGDWDEREEILNKFKLFITEEEHSSRKLYVDYDTIKDSCTNFMFFTNYADAIVLPQNEARYAVYLSTVKRLDDDFYSKYHKWVNSEQGKSALLYWFKTRKISETFNPKGVAPQWNSLKEMSIAGEKSLHQELRSRYDQMLAPFEDNRKIIATTWLYEWCKRNKIKVPRINDIASFLEKIGGINKGQITIEYDSKYYKPTLWVIRHHETLIDVDNKEIARQFLNKYSEDKSIHYIYLFNEPVINAF
jgi:hypothetical protein